MVVIFQRAHQKLQAAISSLTPYAIGTWTGRGDSSRVFTHVTSFNGIFAL